MRQDILKIIGDTENLTNIVILTHNIDLIFLENIVLPVLRKCGHPRLTIFADANCAFESFTRQRNLINSIGTRYRLVPVAMKAGFHFHPKAILLSSKEKAILFVGSGNLGFGGWRENGEIWICFDTEKDGSATFGAFYQYLQQVLGRVPLNNCIKTEIEEAFDPSTRSWIGKHVSASALIGKVDQGKSLVDQFCDFTEQDNIKRLTICVPYLDTKGEMPQELMKRLGTTKAQVLIQSKISNLSKEAAKLLSSTIILRSVGFRKKDATGNQSFLHAKFYACEYINDVMVFAGSANCSRAALAISGSNGNAELMAMQRISKSDFQKNYLDELEFLQSEPEFQEYKENTKEKETDPKIRILAARFEAGILCVSYTCPEYITIKACLVDDKLSDYEIIGERQIKIQLSYKPSRVVLEGNFQSNIFQSNISWIDDESNLRLLSRERSLAVVIHNQVRTDKWSFHAWIDIIRFFQYHLQYIPQSGKIAISINPHAKSDIKKTIYSEADVFSNNYGLPKIDSSLLPYGKDKYIDGLRQILLRWFGTVSYFNENVELTDDLDNLDQNTEDENEEYQLGKSTLKKYQTKREKPNETEIKHAGRIIRKAVKIILQPDYLSNRHPHQFAMDLQLTSILLRLGLAKQWLDIQQFLEFTHNIWSELFFSTDYSLKPGIHSTGWIGYRYCMADDQELFIQQIASIDLSVALASWALAVPYPVETREQALFELACAKSIAEFPWLWNLKSCNDIAVKLYEMLVYTGSMEAHDNYTWSQISDRWKEMIQIGIALCKLQKYLNHLNLSEVRENVSRNEIKEGELLWQGKLGLCIAGENCTRSSRRIIDVLCLQNSEKIKSLQSDYLIPFEALLSKELLPESILLKEGRFVLRKFASQLSHGLVSDLKHT